MTETPSHGLKARRLGIDTHAEPVVFLRKDSTVSRSEGFSPHSRILLSAGARQAIATLYQVENGILARDEAGLSNAAWHLLGLNQGDYIKARHAPPVASLSAMRGRLYGNAFDETTLHEIVSDIVAGRYSDIEIACFLTASAARPLSHAEICALTRAMVNSGGRLIWKTPVVADKHSVGGLPGNRTTPIVVSICAELGLVMPKTSSRAITSPAGTADVMETLAPVVLGEDQIRTVVTQEGACIVWGGGINISPADDILIGIERALDIDCGGQMIAFFISLNFAAGATHLVVDMPVGTTAKIRTPEAARALSAGLEGVAKSFGLEVRVVPGEGTQPIGRGIGPALEARDVLAVLQGEKTAPQDLRSRALELAGALLEMSGKAKAGTGVMLATTVLSNGRAWRKFQRICEVQGGMRTPPLAGFRKDLTATAQGIVTTMDNRRIARLAKLAGAPEDRAAGIEMHIRIGDTVACGTPICTLHAESAGELAYALAYADANADMFRITSP